MIRRRRPEQSDESSEGQAPEPTTEGQEAPESGAGAQPEATDESPAGTEDGDEAADESTPAAQAASGGRKRSRRRRGKGAASDTTSEASPSGDPAAADETAAATSTADAGASTAPADTPDESATDADTGTAEESAADDGAGGSEPPGAVPPRRRGGRGLALLALVIALAAAGGAGWLGWRVLQLERQVAAVPEQRERALAPLASQDALDSVEQRLDRGLGSLEDAQQRLSQLADEQQRLQGEHQAVLADLRTRLETVETALQNLRDQRERGGNDWRMAEVRYLVSIAVQRLAISGDVAGSVAALQAADQSLARMGDPRVIELRKRIVDDIEALQAVEPADVEGIAVRIQSLAPRIPHLEPPAPSTPPTAEASAAPDTPSEAEPQGWWASIRARLQSLVTVRRETEASGPAAPAAPEQPAPSAELPAGERLLLTLKDASRAALNHAPQAYEEAIGRALDLLAAEYAESAPVVDRFRQALEELRARRVTTDLPDLGPTLERAQTLAARLEGGGSGAASQGDN